MESGRNSVRVRARFSLRSAYRHHKYRLDASRDFYFIFSERGGALADFSFFHFFHVQQTTSRIVCHTVQSCFALLSFVFRHYAFVEAAALRSIVLRYTGAPIATRVSFFLDMSLFSSIFCTIWRVRRTFFPSEWCFSTL